MNYLDLKQNLINTVLKLEYMFHELYELLEKYREDLVITRTLLEKEEQIIAGEITQSDFLMENNDEEKEEDKITHYIVENGIEKEYIVQKSDTDVVFDGDCNVCFS